MRDTNTPTPAFAATIRALELPAKWSGKLAAWLILPMVGVLVYEVFARYVFNRPTIWAYDITYMLYGSLFMLGASYTLQRGSHVRADFLYNHLAVRWQGVIDASMHLLLFFPAISIFLWLTLQFALTSWGQGERIPTSPWMPIVYPFKTVLPITGLLLLIQGVPEFLKSVYAAIHNQRYPL
jgi:TRAP-type mannitol/chloroaromatic compound transport system permease small subunit